MGERQNRARELIAALQRKSFLGAKVVRQRLRPRTAQEIPLTVFVSGVQRSGTTMTMYFLRASYETTVFGDLDKRAFEQQLLRPPRGTTRAGECRPISDDPEAELFDLVRRDASVCQIGRVGALPYLVG